MPSHLSHSSYWRLQAQEARLTAQRLEDPEAKAAMLKKADDMTASPPATGVGS